MMRYIAHRFFIIHSALRRLLLLSLRKVSLSEKIDARLDLQGHDKEPDSNWQLYHYILKACSIWYGYKYIQRRNSTILGPVLISFYYPLISLLPSDTSLQILKTYLNLEKIGFKKNRYQLYNPFVSRIKLYSLRVSILSQFQTKHALYSAWFSLSLCFIIV